MRQLITPKPPSFCGQHYYTVIGRRVKVFSSTSLLCKWFGFGYKVRAPGRPTQVCMFVGFACGYTSGPLEGVSEKLFQDFW